MRSVATGAVRPTPAGATAGGHALPAVVRAMLDPGFYPHPTAPEVRLGQTHISYVLLSGDYAYKVKKPVNLGFLDFSTLERRRHFCEEEVRLNQRGAPALYFGVVPVTRADARGALELGGTGTPVEYCVKMRQFPERCLLSEALGRGAFGEADAVNLAQTIAAYHAAAPVVPGGGPFGAPALLRAGIDLNYRQTERFVGILQDEGWAEDTLEFTNDFLTRRAWLLADRVKQGRIRECHGDLHLGNVCRWAGRTLLFDCIEFNDEFRCVDVMCDIAFAAMDLDARGHPALANAFVNAYAERSGDWDGLQVLPLYLCRNAYVRAKVNSFLSEDASLGPGEADAAAQRATRYYELARCYARRPRHRGRLVIVCGMSGSGKTTLARHLARRWRAVHIRSDAVRKHLAGCPLDARGDAEMYSLAMTDRTYARLLELGVRLAADGNVVILDARYARAAFRAAVLAAADRHGLPVHIVHCIAPADVLRGRLAARATAGDDASDATTQLLDAQYLEDEAFAGRERRHLLTLDTCPTADVLAARVDAWARCPAVSPPGAPACPACGA